MQALELTDSKTFNYHAQAASDSNIGGGMASLHPSWTVYEIPVLYNTDAYGNGGGMKPTKFYSPHNVFEIGLRTRNTPHKSMLMNWLVNIGNELVQQGFVIDQYAFKNDPNVVVHLNSRSYAHNYTQARHDMADQNKSFLPIIAKCTDSFGPTGLLNSVVSYCTQRMHNTAHVSVHGMTAKQLVYARINSQDPFLGQQTFAGQFCPVPSEYSNACNYLSEAELNARTYTIYNALARIQMYLNGYNKLGHREMLTMFTMHCLSPHIEFRGWNHHEYPETAIHTVLNFPKRNELKAYIRDAANTWEALYPNRHSLDHYHAGQFAEAEYILCEVCATGADLFD